MAVKKNDNATYDKTSEFKKQFCEKWTKLCEELNSKYDFSGVRLIAYNEEGE